MNGKRCRFGTEELIAYDDRTLSPSQREIVDAHLAVCPHCRERMAAFHEVDRIVRAGARPVEVSARRRQQLRARLHDAHQRADASPRLLSPLAARVLVPIMLALLLLPSVGRADFPLDHFVRLGPIESTGTLPPEEQVVIRHAAPSDPDVPPPSFPVVAPLELPNGFHRVHWSTPGPDRLEQLYRNDAGVDLLVTQVPAEEGMVTIEGGGADYLMVRDTPVLLTADVRPDSVMEMTWERDGVFVDVLVVEAPTGPYGGFRRADALQVVEAIMAAQDVGEVSRKEERWADD